MRSNLSKETTQGTKNVVSLDRRSLTQVNYCTKCGVFIYLFIYLFIYILEGGGEQAVS